MIFIVVFFVWSVVVVFLPATGTWGVSESWGYQNSDRDLSVPRIHWLLLLIYFMPLPALYILLPMYSWGSNLLLTLLYRHHRPPSLSLHRIIQPPGRPLFPYQNAKPPRLPLRFPHSFLRSTEICPSPSVSNSPHHHSIPGVENSSSWPPLSLPLPDSCHHTLAATKIFSILSLSCDLGAVLIHQGSRRLPPPSHPVSFSHTLYIGRNTTKSDVFGIYCGWCVCIRFFYYCVCTPVLVMGMEHPEWRIFLNVGIYSGKL